MAQPNMKKRNNRAPRSITNAAFKSQAPDRNYHDERLRVADLFAHSQFHDLLSEDESASMPFWLMFAPIADVRELERQIKNETR